MMPIAARIPIGTYRFHWCTWLVLPRSVDWRDGTPMQAFEGKPLIDFKCMKATGCSEM